MQQITNKIYRYAVICCVSVFLCAGWAAGQTPPEPPAVKPKIKVTPPPSLPKPPEWKGGRRITNESGMPAEKAIEVDEKINVSLCVSAGKVKVSGWDRREVRAFVTDGSPIGFKTLQKSRQSEKPVWIMVLGFDPATNTETRPDECLAGDLIELDVPRNAIINIKSRESEAIINSVGKVRLENVSGDIFLNNVKEGIEATTYEGSVMVENSGGAMALTSTTGNIVALDVSPSEIGDIFKAKTNSGAVVLQSVEHRQLEVSSTSGTVKYSGEFLNGGQYSLRTSNGSMMLCLPQNASAKVSASYGFGSFDSEIPMNNVVKPPGARVQNFTGVLGSGEATLSLTTYNGRILIRNERNCGGPGGEFESSFKSGKLNRVQAK